MPQGYNIHDMLDSVLAQVEGREPIEDELEKNASAEDAFQPTQVPTEDEVAENMKLADALWLLADHVSESPDTEIEIDLEKEAMTEAVGGGTRPTAIQAAAGTQGTETGQSNNQGPKSGLKGGVKPGKGATHVAFHEATPDQPLSGLQKKSQVEQLRHEILQKLAGPGSVHTLPTGLVAGSAWGKKARISDTPLPAGSQTKWKAGEGPMANEPGESLVGSNQAAIDATKRDAKKARIPELKKLLKERALSAKTDKVLQSAWSRTRQAGAKIASAEGVDVRDKLGRMMAKLGRI